MYIYSYIDRKEQLALTLMIINGLVHETVKLKKITYCFKFCEIQNVWMVNFC